MARPLKGGRTVFSTMVLPKLDVCLYVCVVCAQLCPILCDLMDCVVHQAPLSMEFSRQGYWSGLSFPTLGDLPNPVIKHVSLASPALVSRVNLVK